MNAIVFVSLVSALSTPATTVQGPSVTVRSLVQGSGTVITFEHASAMPRQPVSVVRGGK